jgi:hypothetical protein
MQVCMYVAIGIRTYKTQNSLDLMFYNPSVWTFNDHTLLVIVVIFFLNFALFFATHDLNCTT